MCELRSNLLAVFSVFILFFLAKVSFAQITETITLETYYPSPYGAYEELTSNKLAVFNVASAALPAEYVDMRPGDVRVGRSLIVGSAAPFSYNWLNPFAGPDTRPGPGSVLIEGTVGIGTTNVQDQLHVRESGGSSDTEVITEYSGSGGGTAATYSVGSYNDGTFRVRYRSPGPGRYILAANSAGNVGIGTLTPTSPAPNGQPGNLDVNDIYLRSRAIWISAMTPDCTTIVSMGNQADCPAGYTVTGCGTFNSSEDDQINGNGCLNNENHVWARCCRVL